MDQKYMVLNECNKIIDLYREETKKQQENAVPVLYKAFYDAAIDNKTKLYEKIRRTRNVEELASYMRDGSFAEDAGGSFAAQMLAAMINSDIISSYDEFVKNISEVLKKYDCNADQFEQYAKMWSDQMIQPVMKKAEERRLQIVEIGTGAGSEGAKKLHGFIFGKATEVAITVIWKNNQIGKQAGKLMRKYLGKGEFKAQRNNLAQHVLDHIEEYANEIAVWLCDGYNDIYTARIKMAGQLLDDYARLYL